MMRNYSALFVFVALLNPGSALASPERSTMDLPEVASPTEPSNSEFPPEVPFEFRNGTPWPSYFLNHPSLKSMTLGVIFQGSTPLQKNPSLPMLPASVQKVFTASTALQVLGRQMRFENSFEGDWDSSTNRLTRPRFRVSGDPTWGSDDFEGIPGNEAVTLRARLAGVISALKAKGVKTIQGPIEVESLRPGLAAFSRPAGWKSTWVTECMAMIPTEFIANGNCGTLHIASRYRYGWTTPGVTVPIQARFSKTKSSRSQVMATPVLDAQGRVRSYVLSGVVGTQAPVDLYLPVHQSSAWLKNLMVQMVLEAGITYLESSPEYFNFPLGPYVERWSVDLSSRPLIEILQTAVQNSLNGVMDRIYLEIGYHLAIADPSQAVLNWIRTLTSDASLMSQIEIHDGSGLDTTDRMRPDTLYQFLWGARSDPGFADFLSTLAVAGKSGTLLHRSTLVASPQTNGKIYAKTGTLDGITNLAGYLVRGQTEPEPFVVLSESDFDASTARKAIDGLVVNFATQNSKR